MIAELLKVKEQIRHFIIENYIFDDEGQSFKDDDSFLENGIIDSTGVVELVLFVEETFGVTVEDEEVVPENFDSLEKLAAFVRSKGGDR